MRHILFLFYILFFATGFMGVTALAILRLRITSRLTCPFLWFQILFLAALGLSLVFAYLDNIPDVPAFLPPALIYTVLTLNASLYAVVVVVVYGLSIKARRKESGPHLLYKAAMISSSLSVLKMTANIVVAALSSAGYIGPAWMERGGSWSLTGYILNTVSMLLFGISAVRAVPIPGESKITEALLRGYGICTLVFAPLGLTEYLFEYLTASGVSWFSMDHFYYFAWNIISMSAAVRLFRPSSDNSQDELAVPGERVRALGLSVREKEMAVLIARGLSNKEIAAELGITPATVRTHIYNLYKKAGVRSRVELLNSMKK